MRPADGDDIADGLEGESLSGLDLEFSASPSEEFIGRIHFEPLAPCPAEFELHRLRSVDTGRVVMQLYSLRLLGAAVSSGQGVASWATRSGSIAASAETTCIECTSDL